MSTTLTSEQMQKLKHAAETGILGNAFEGMRVGFTGTMSMKREDMVQLLKAVGGLFDMRVTWGTNYVVHGDTGRFGVTNKMQQAERMGAKLISEEEFVRMLLMSTHAP